MKMSSRYVFGAALALTGLATGIDGIVGEAQAAPITAAGFSFDSTALGAGSTINSFSSVADIGVGSITMARTPTGTVTTGTIGSVSGSGTPKALVGNNLYGSSSLYNFKFSIDGLQAIVFSFDTTGSATGPRDFEVTYSLDGSTYSPLGSYSIASTGSTAFSTGASAAVFNRSFSLPASFSDTNPLAAGEFGFLRIGVVGTVPINVTATASSNTGGTNRIDNAFIVGQAIPEPASATVLTLAAAALLGLRRHSR